MPKTTTTRAVKTSAVAVPKTTKKAPMTKKAVVKKTTAKRPTRAPVASAEKAKKPKKQKVIRDSFTMPKSEYEHIARLKLLCITAGMAVKKSELLRAGLLVLGRLSGADLAAVIGSLDTVKTGRPLSSSNGELAKARKKSKKTNKK